FLLVEGFALGRHKDYIRLAVSRDCLVALPYRFRHHQHALTLAVGGVVYPLVLVKGIVSYLMAFKLKHSCLPRSSHDACRKPGLAQLREQSGYVNPHRTAPP